MAHFHNDNDELLIKSIEELGIGFFNAVSAACDAHDAPCVLWRHVGVHAGHARHAHVQLGGNPEPCAAGSDCDCGDRCEPQGGCHFPQAIAMPHCMHMSTCR